MPQPDRTQELETLLGQRILILDGAMGTMIQRHKLDEAAYRGERFKDWPSDLKGNNDLLAITQPEVIQGIHEAYLEAGADILETNTFNGTSIAMADYAMEDLSYEINLEATRLARKAADKYSTSDKPRFVMGSLGPGPASPVVAEPDLQCGEVLGVGFGHSGEGGRRVEDRAPLGRGFRSGHPGRSADQGLQPVLFRASRGAVRQ